MTEKTNKLTLGSLKDLIDSLIKLDFYDENDIIIFKFKDKETCATVNLDLTKSFSKDDEKYQQCTFDLTDF